ncbi:transposase [Alkaliphilus sp. MSJ-5]|uniref:Transposase n=1 Tax=Alkaliphilus flagellatus TaxID=2841507 RepID=A0ABS6G419_9FIRM|nr:transposase [Alkaliphilus flagellatus]MBU5676155.1 transposase [Alkaliphilus flagellatus]
MAREARKRSNTGIYHVMLRGIDKRDIFLDDEDRKKFIENVIRAKEAGGFEIYGYCLMDNHIHMLIKEDEEIGISIKRITVGYIGWHNNKYERTGHLFQNRYKSEPVETENYLITVLRYIHQNPVKARIIDKLENYNWSSHKEYLLTYQGHSSFINTELIKSYFRTAEDFISYMNVQNSDECLEYKPVKKYNDDTFKKIIHKKYNINDLNKLSVEERNKLIKNIYNETDISIRQLSRILGIGKTIVERAVKKDD